MINRTSLLGLLFILAGIFVLLVNLQIISLGHANLWILAILAVNCSFFILSKDRLSWGQRVFGYMLLSLAATGVAGIEQSLTAVSSASLGFLVSYFYGDKRTWWLLAPAGIFSGLALFMWLSRLYPALDSMPIMLLIFAGTFTLLYLLPEDYGGREWALIPSLGLIVLTVIANDPVGRSDSLLIIIALVVIMTIGWAVMRNRKPS